MFLRKWSAVSLFEYLESKNRGLYVITGNFRFNMNAEGRNSILSNARFPANVCTISSIAIRRNFLKMCRRPLAAAVTNANGMTHRTAAATGRRCVIVSAPLSSITVIAGSNFDKTEHSVVDKMRTHAAND